MSQSAILRALRDGPKTNRQLQEVVGEAGGVIAKYAARLRHSGRVERIDGKVGRGTDAVYALTEKGRK